MIFTRITTKVLAHKNRSQKFIKKGTVNIELSRISVCFFSLYVMFFGK